MRMLGTQVQHILWEYGSRGNHDGKAEDQLAARRAVIKKKSPFRYVLFLIILFSLLLAREQRPSHGKPNEEAPLPPVARLYSVPCAWLMRYSGRSGRLTRASPLTVLPLCRLYLLSPRPPRLDAIRHSRPPTKGNLSPVQPESHISYIFPFDPFISSSHPSSSYEFQSLDCCSVLFAPPVEVAHLEPPSLPAALRQPVRTRPVTPYLSRHSLPSPTPSSYTPYLSLIAAPDNLASTPIQNTLSVLLGTALG